MDAANLNMEIASDSCGVFFGSYNAGSNGFGAVQAFGDLRPGNSPAIGVFTGWALRPSTDTTSVPIATLTLMATATLTGMTLTASYLVSASRRRGRASRPT